jgi:hypothetical protein
MDPLKRNNIKCGGAKELLPHNNSAHCHLSKKTVQHLQWGLLSPKV